MAISRVKTWTAETLTASDLNAEFNNILNNALSLISPLTGTLDIDNNRLDDIHAGTVGDPSINFNGDSNTGFYSPEADAFAITCGGVNMLNVQGSGTYLHAIEMSGAFTSDGSATSAAILANSATLTGASGDTVALYGTVLSSNVTTQGASETITTVAQLWIDEPNITVGSGDTVTNSASLYIAGAATEATNDYSVWVDSGLSRFDSAVIIGAATNTAFLTVEQSSASGAIPVLHLTQDDVSEEMIEFETTVGTGNAIEAVGAKTLTTTHFVKVTLNGVGARYFPIGTIA